MNQGCHTIEKILVKTLAHVSEERRIEHSCICESRHSEEILHEWIFRYSLNSTFVAQFLDMLDY